MSFEADQGIRAAGIVFVCAVVVIIMTIVGFILVSVFSG